MALHPYLSFEGRCEEVIAFYREAAGAQVVMLMRNRESPDPAPPGMLPANAGDKVLHAHLTIGGGTLMASDGMCSGQPQFGGFSLYLAQPDADAARRCFDALAAGGKVTMPLGPTFWSPCFGMLTDRFGLGWMVTVEEAQA
jgi:PhnB protein